MSSNKSVHVNYSTIRGRAYVFIARKHMRDRSELFTCNCLNVQPRVSVVVRRVYRCLKDVFRREGIEIDRVQSRDDRTVYVHVSM
jgi:hypothetical protein